MHVTVNNSQTERGLNIMLYKIAMPNNGNAKLVAF